MFFTLHVLLLWPLFFTIHAQMTFLKLLRKSLPSYEMVYFPTPFDNKCLFSLFNTQFTTLRFNKFNPICLTFAFHKNTLTYGKYFTLESAETSSNGFSSLRCLLCLVFRECNCSNPRSVLLEQFLIS